MVFTGYYSRFSAPPCERNGSNSHPNDLRMRYKKIPVVINIRRISSPENIDFTTELNILKSMNRQLCFRAWLLKFVFLPFGNKISLKRDVEIAKP